MVALVVALVGPGCSKTNRGSWQADEDKKWQLFQMPDCGFAVEMPEEPERELWDWNEQRPDRPMPSTDYSVRADVTYSVSCVRDPSGYLPKERGQLFDFLERKYVSFTATALGGHKSVTREEVYAFGNQGIAMTMHSKRGRVVQQGRIFPDGDKLHVMTVISNSLGHPGAIRFFASYRLDVK